MNVKVIWKKIKFCDDLLHFEKILLPWNMPSAVEGLLRVPNDSMSFLCTHTRFATWLGSNHY